MGKGDITKQSIGKIEDLHPELSHITLEGMQRSKPAVQPGTPVKEPLSILTPE